MSAYADIDDVIRIRVEGAGSTLFVEWAGAEARFFYVSGGVECFQVSVDPPVGGRVQVVACSVDTVDDQQFEQSWRGPVDDIDRLLALALAKVEEWKNRS